MTDTPIADGIHHRHEAPAPQPRLIDSLQQLTDVLRANPLAARLLETGVGLHLSHADVDTVFRSAQAIESARAEIPLGRAVYGGPDSETIA